MNDNERSSSDIICNHLNDKYYCIRMYIDYNSTLYINIIYPNKYALLYFNFENSLPLFLVEHQLPYFYMEWLGVNGILDTINIDVNSHYFFNYTGIPYIGQHNYIRNYIDSDELVNITIPIAITQFALLKSRLNFTIELHDPVLNETIVRADYFSLFQHCMLCVYRHVLFCV